MIQPSDTSGRKPGGSTAMPLTNGGRPPTVNARIGATRVWWTRVTTYQPVIVDLIAVAVFLQI